MIHAFDRPRTLDGLKPLGAVEAVIADMREHPLTLDGMGLFVAVRHYDLLCRLAADMAAAATENGPNSAPTLRPSADAHAQAAEFVGCAISQYTDALSSLVAIASPGTQSTPRKQLDVIGHHRQLRTSLNQAAQSLLAARARLHYAVHRAPTHRSPVPPPSPSTTRGPRP